VTIKFEVNGWEYGSAANVLPQVTASQMPIADDQVKEGAWISMYDILDSNEASDF